MKTQKPEPQHSNSSFGQQCRGSTSLAEQRPIRSLRLLQQATGYEITRKGIWKHKNPSLIIQAAALDTSALVTLHTQLGKAERRTVF